MAKILRVYNPETVTKEERERIEKELCNLRGNESDDELIAKSTVISENKEKNRRLMKAPDGHVFLTCINRKTGN